MWIEALENGLLRHQANAVREILDFDAILSGPTVFPTQRVALQQLKIRCQGLFAANKEPPCQESLRFELWMKKYETSIGSIENSQTLPTQDEKKDETCTNEYE